MVTLSGASGSGGALRMVTLSGGQWQWRSLKNGDIKRWPVAVKEARMPREKQAKALLPDFHTSAH